MELIIHILTYESGGGQEAGVEVEVVVVGCCGSEQQAN